MYFTIILQPTKINGQTWTYEEMLEKAMKKWKEQQRRREECRADTPPTTNWKEFLLDHAMFDSTGRIVDKKIDET